MAQIDRRQMVSLTRGLQLVPASAADVVAKNCYVFQVVVSNIHTSAVTFTVVDKQSSARTLVPTVSLAANSLTIISLPEGCLMKGGVNWVAGTADKLHAEIVGFYVP